MSQPISCLFLWGKKAYSYNQATRTVEPVLNPDGSHRVNDNWISFLQVISCYWEPIEEGKQQLNIFLNGGSVSRDRETGDTQMKSGYTVVLPEFLGTKFLNQFYAWSLVYGQSNNGAAPQHSTVARESRPRTQNRQVKEDDFVDPLATETAAVWEK